MLNLNPARTALTNFLDSRQQFGKISLKDDPHLLRVVVKTEGLPTPELKAEIRKAFPSYFIIWKTFAKTDE